jgi:hypothetical protein
MTANEFIDALKIVVHDSSFHGIESSLQRPSGRRPPPNLVAASAWFTSLKEDDRDIIRLIIALSIHSAIFGVLAVIDGVSAIQDQEEKGQLILNFEDNSGVTRLNDSQGEMLHDIYQSRVYDEVFTKRG